MTTEHKLDEWTAALDKLVEVTARYRDAVQRNSPGIEVVRTSMILARQRYIRLTFELD